VIVIFLKGVEHSGRQGQAAPRANVFPAGGLQETVAAARAVTGEVEVGFFRRGGWWCGRLEHSFCDCLLDSFGDACCSALTVQVVPAV
jgi:hypothetical protein